jgi:hypothetical protein
MKSSLVSGHLDMLSVILFRVAESKIASHPTITALYRAAAVTVPTTVFFNRNKDGMAFSNTANAASQITVFCSSA